MTVKNIFKKYRSGFTLVELLIVIALLAVISLIVIAAINPIEQANRARDTKYNADAGQLVSALERYDAVNSEFPWVTTGFASSNETAFGFTTASSSDIGICGDATCSSDGLLITSAELKSEFRNRGFIKSTSASEIIQIGKRSGSTQSIYACFVPLSIATRQKSCAEGLVYTLGANGARTQVPSSTCASSTADWSASGWNICLPN